MFTTAAAIFLRSAETTAQTPPNGMPNIRNPIGKFPKLLQEIERRKYRIHLHQLQSADLEVTLTEYLKLHDIVIVIGCLTEELFTAVANVYDEHWNDDCKETSLEINENTEYRHFQIIGEAENHILKLHRFYFIDADSKDGDFCELLKQLEGYTRKPVYSKKFQYNKDDVKVVTYVEKLLSKENGIRAKRVADNEVVITSGNIEDINRLQQGVVDFPFESSHVLEEYEEEILNSPCLFIQEAIQYIKKCFDTYQPENVFICFNGGKDCTVLLHLMLLILRKFYLDYESPVFCMYIQSRKPFPQVTAFIDKARLFYNLEVHTLTLGIKDGLATILNERPNLKACLMGTRRSDPFSANMNHFQPTDNDWPSIMRVSPLLDWEFAHVWDYLVSFKVPYCCLYDEGYTSLGNVDNTLKNPQLLNEETGDYYPAYRLLKSTKERSGRM